MTATAQLLRVVMTAAISLLATAAVAQLQLTPQPQSPPAKKSDSGVQKRQDAKKKAAPKKDTQKSTDSQKAAKGGPKTEQPPLSEDPNVDLAYGAYQRGKYGEAFQIASRRAQELGDAKAMTLLGELYANGQGVNR